MYTYVYIHRYLYLYTYTYIHVSMYTYMYVYVYANTRTHAHTKTHTCVRKHTHICVQTYTHTHTHIRAHAFVFSLRKHGEARRHIADSKRSMPIQQQRHWANHIVMLNQQHHLKRLDQYGVKGVVRRRSQHTARRGLSSLQKQSPTTTHRARKITLSAFKFGGTREQQAPWLRRRNLVGIVCCSASYHWDTGCAGGLLTRDEQSPECAPATERKRAGHVYVKTEV